MYGIKFLSFSIINLLILSVLSKDTIGPITKSDHDLIEKGIDKLTEIFQIKDYLNTNSTNDKNTKFLGVNKVSSHPINETVICKMCEYTFSKVHNFLQKKYGLKWLLRLVTWLCSWGLKYEVCKGSIDLWESKVVDSIIEHYFDHEYICSSRFVCQFSHYVELDPDDYARKLLEDKPNKTQIEHYHLLNKRNSNKTFKVLHITDLHTDFYYEEGSLGNCGDFVCCRKYNGKPSKKEDIAAGRWGFVGFCDLPIVTVYNFLEHIKNNIKPDIILWTGDSNSHSVWNSTQQETINVVTLLCTLMKDKFNFSMPIYPAIGNHEFFPADEFNPFNSTDNFVIFNLTANLWKDWIGTEAINKYLENGYYTIYNFDLNLRVISLNTMDCDTINFNLIKNPTDPANQFAWMEKVLRSAEKAGEYVFIIGHIPPGDYGYLSQCAKRYNALIDRFSYIIKGQFFGHSHFDEFRIVHEYFNYSNVAGVIYTAPSVTTYSNRMPSFRVYDVNSANIDLIDYTQYYLNITKANLMPDDIPKWEIQYTAIKDFKVKNLMDYEGFSNLTKQLTTNNDVFQNILLKFLSDGPDYIALKNLTNFNKYISCRFDNDSFDNYIKCTRYRTWFSAEYTSVLLEYLTGNWYKKYHDEDEHKNDIININ